MEKPRQPGTARFGNFINYYEFNPPDRRLQLIPRSLMADLGLAGVQRTVHVLDIGCNAGNLTERLMEHFLAEDTSLNIKVLGIDLDERLISRCKEKTSHPESITYSHADIMTQEGIDVVTHYMKDNDIERFDLVTCFSITMWVHLNHGDKGLQQFLSQVATLSSNLLIEPQPWTCYRNACRRMQKLDCEPFQHFKTLQWRSDVAKEIETFLKVTCAMDLRTKYGLTASWKRPVCLFSKVE